MDQAHWGPEGCSSMRYIAMPDMSFTVHVRLAADCKAQTQVYLSELIKPQSDLRSSSELQQQNAAS